MRDARVSSAFFSVARGGGPEAEKTAALFWRCFIRRSEKLHKYAYDLVR